MHKKAGSNDKRNYIRRKKYLQDCASNIKATIDLMAILKGNEINNEDSEKQAVLYARQIEAVCWSPRSQMSAENYQKLMLAKTREFTRSILGKTIPLLDINQLHKNASALILEYIQHQASSSPLNFEILKSIKLNSSALRSEICNFGLSRLNEKSPPINKISNSILLNNLEETALNRSNASKPNNGDPLENYSSNVKNIGLFISNGNKQQNQEPKQKYNKQKNRCKKENNSTNKHENSIETSFTISASEIMSIFEFGDGSSNNPYFIPNVERDINIEEKNELYPILFESDELTKNIDIFSSTLSLNGNEGIKGSDSFINELIL